MGLALRNCFADEVFHCLSPQVARTQLKLAPERLENGNVIVDGVQFFKIGTGFEQRGAAGKFDFTDKHAAEIVRNFREDLGEGYEVFLTIGHPDRLDMAEAVAWVKDLTHKVGVGVFARVELLAETYGKLKDRKFKYFSPTFSLKARDMYGKPVGAKLWTGGILNNPFWTGMTDFSAVLSSQTGSIMAGKFKVKIKKDDGTDVSSEERMAALETAVTELSAAVEPLSALADSIKELSSKVDSIKLSASPETESDDEDEEEDADDPKVVELSKKVKASDEKVIALERAALSRDVASVLRRAKEKRVFKRAQLGADWGTNKFNGADWLDKSNFKNLSALIDHVETSDPIIALSDDKESSGDEGTNGASGFDSVASPDVINLARELKCSPEDVVRRSKPGYRPGIS